MNAYQICSEIPWYRGILWRLVSCGIVWFRASLPDIRFVIDSDFTRPSAELIKVRHCSNIVRRSNHSDGKLVWQKVKRLVFEYLLKHVKVKGKSEHL